MKRMVYFCPVDWRWIKQRPQFLAEELSRFFDIHVIYPFSKNRRGLQKGGKDQIRKTPYWTLPTLGGRLTFVANVNRHLVRMQAGVVFARVKPEVIWITLPEQLDCIPKNYRGKVVYDCMDDYAAFNEGNAQQEEIVRLEGELVHRADLVFATSESLRSKLCSRYGLSSASVVLLRNGYNAKWKLTPAGEKRNGRLKIGYFGTISHWFDFPLLANSLRSHEDIEYHLYGPLAGGVQIPADERMIYHGVVEHDEIERCAAQLDALMMPFELNELILSVDPVKLYEYICLNKNILCVRYPEVERFSPFVLFYNGQEEYDAQIRELCRDDSVRYLKTDAEVFLRENSWTTRAQTAHQKIKDHLFRRKEQ